MVVRRSCAPVTKWSGGDGKRHTHEVLHPSVHQVETGDDRGGGYDEPSRRPEHGAEGYGDTVHELEQGELGGQEELTVSAGRCSGRP